MQQALTTIDLVQQKQFFNQGEEIKQKIDGLWEELDKAKTTL